MSNKPSINNSDNKKQKNSDNQPKLPLSDTNYKTKKQGFNEDRIQQEDLINNEENLNSNNNNEVDLIITNESNNLDKLNVMNFGGLRTGELKNICLNNESDIENSYKKENEKDDNVIVIQQNNKFANSDHENEEECNEEEEFIDDTITQFFAIKLAKMQEEYEKLKQEIKELKKKKQIYENLKTNNMKNKIYRGNSFNKYDQKKINLLPKNQMKNAVKILDRMAEEELFKGVGTTKQILNGIAPRCLERSLYVYKNKNCHTCSKLLNRGKSAHQCPKCKYLNY